MIRNIDKIDAITLYPDGIVDMKVVIFGNFDVTRDLQALIRKIGNYIVYINGDEFKKEYNNPDKQLILMDIMLNGEVSEEVMKLLNKIADWIRRNGVRAKITSR